MRTDPYKYRNIIASMTQNGDTVQSLSQKLGLSYRTLRARLEGRRDFELPEIYALLRLYRQPLEVLFAESDAPGTGSSV